MALFNDGDDAIHRNNPKTLGSAGGIYWLNPNKMDDMDGNDRDDNNYIYIHHTCKAALHRGDN